MPLKSQGVNRSDDSGFIIRCKFITVPGKQFVVRRFAYIKIPEAFEAEGIKFAPKRVIAETAAPLGPKKPLMLPLRPRPSRMKRQLAATGKER